jgi:hypothetical protein
VKNVEKTFLRERAAKKPTPFQPQWLILSLALLVFMAASPRAEWVRTVVLELGYGHEPGQFYNYVRRGDAILPQSFDIDAKGNIYFLDQYNNRIQVFNKSGELKTIIPVEGVKYAEDIGIHDEDNSAYIEAREIVANQKGEILVRKFDRRPGVDKNRQAPVFLYKGGRWVEATDKDTQTFERRGFRKERIKELLESFPGYRTEGGVPSKRVLLGKFEVSDVFKRKQGVFVTGHGEKSNYGRTTDVVRKYDFNGKLRSELQLIGWPFQVGHPKIDAKGNVYVLELIPLESGELEEITPPGMVLLRYEEK